jgi:hypothetical protein
MPVRKTSLNQKVVWLGVGLLLCIWLTRLIAIDRFPPFIDETIHIRLAEDGAHISPLIRADLGRAFTGWWHLLFQSYAAGTLWVARVATTLAVLVGIAAVMGIAKLAAGEWGMGLAGLLYGSSSYHFFFERLALSDPLSSAAVCAALYFAYRLAKRVNDWDAALTGGLLFLAFGAKVSVIPYYGIPMAAALALRPKNRRWRSQMRWLAIALLTMIAPTILFVIGLRLVGHDLLTNSFSLAASNRQALDMGALLSIPRIAQNVLMTVGVFAAYWGIAAFALLMLAVCVLLVRRKDFLPLCLLAPALAMWTSLPQETRYWIPAGAILLLCGAVVLAEAAARWGRWLQLACLVGIVAWGGLQWLPFAVTAGQDPANLPLPAVDYAQYVASDAAGFGLLEVRDYLRGLEVRQVIGVLSNCDGLRYLAQKDFTVTCPRVNPNGQDIPALTRLMAQSRAKGVYVVLEDSPYTPKTAPGSLLITLHRPGGKASLSIYDLAP